jgi:hypothetical protein
MGTCLVILIVVGICAHLALPGLVRGKSWGRYFAAFALSLLMVVVPLFVFFVSALLAPDGKDVCQHGWVDCFHLGKIALSPLVLWATAAFYSAEIYRVANPTAPWIVAGYFVGALVSSVCLAFGLLYVGRDTGLLLFLLVPAYVTFWYSLRTGLLLQTVSNLATCGKALVASLPFWVASVLWSRSQYKALPEHGCFVVSAASRGHRRLVGPFTTVVHRGCCVEANRQLMTMWDFEKWWQVNAPRSHTCFRRFYNRVGPMVARQIGSRWTADLVYLVLKPLEIGASLAVSSAENRPVPRGIPQVSQIEQWGRLEGPRKGQAL